MLQARTPQSSQSKAQDAPQIAHDASHQQDNNVISCTICNALYTLAPAHQDLLQTSDNVLEAVLMSTCHFCFRCRRAACPSCWDAVHGICGACVQEVQLPFRTQVAPLAETVFPAKPAPSTVQKDTSSTITPLLVCLQPGRFQVVPSTDSLKAMSIESSSSSTARGEVEAEEAPRARHAIPKRASLRASQAKEAGSRSAKTTVELPKRKRGKAGFLRIAERIVTFVLLIVLLAIIALIIVAEVSLPANTQIMHLLHVDIRDEVAYLMYLIHQLVSR